MELVRGAAKQSRQSDRMEIGCLKGMEKKAGGGLDSKDDTIEAENKVYQADLNVTMVEATRMAAENIGQREATGICPIQVESLATHMVDDGDNNGNDAPTTTEWML